MRKHLLITLLFLSTIMSFADPIDPQRALRIAQDYLVPGHAMTMKVMGKARKAASKSAPYYIISRGENQGYVIVAGDDALPEVLGYTESGDFDEQNMPPFLTWFLDTYGQMAEAAQSVNASRRKSPAKAATDRVDISPLIQTHWDQSRPYNNLCPDMKDGSGKTLTGCVATAASQVAYYWHKDLTSVTLADVNGYDWCASACATRSFKKGTPLKWDLMLNKYGSEPAEYHEAVATLMAIIGTGAGLDYGTSAGTSGHNANCINVFSKVLGMNGGKENNKDWGEEYNNYSDEAWATLLYNELVAGRPILYSGCGDNGGHAVVVDGYQASTGYFHFNLGWGGGGDGYFTVARGKSPSWGFNTSWQECVTGISPKRFNLDTKFFAPAKVLLDVPNKFIVELTNNSTLPYKGVYLFANTTGKAPTELSAAKSKDDKTIIEVGETMSFELSAKPTSAKKWYFFVTDKSLNVLAEKSFEPGKTQSHLELKDFILEGSSVTEEFDGQKFNVVYGEKTTVLATFRNAGSFPYEDTQRIIFYGYDDESKTWNEVGYKTSKLTIDPKEQLDLTFSLFTSTAFNIEQDKYYYGVICNPVPNTDDYISIDEGCPTVVRFILRKADMDVVSFENNVLTMKGNFDNTAFSSIYAKKNAYKSATIYDLTQCTGVGYVSQEVNPNALIYVADESQAMGVNIVKGDKCAKLRLTPGYNFTPRADFVAERAELVIGDEVARWYLLTSPFEAEVPSGIIAREITAHNTSGISNKTVEVTTLEPGKTYLVMATSKDNLVLKGYNVKVSANPMQNKDVAIVGTYTNATLPAGAMLINNEDKQYFVPMEEGSAVEAMRGYFYDVNTVKEFRAYSSTTLDPVYRDLARYIQSAYEVLHKYEAITKASAYETFLAKIHEVESAFSSRAYDTATLVKKSYAQLEADGIEYMKQIADVGYFEVDFTSCITNPSFESKNTSGWKLGTMEGIKTVGSAVIGNNANSSRAVGLDGDYVFQSIIASADSSSVSLSQEVNGLTPGYYCLQAKVGTGIDRKVTLFAGDKVATVSGHNFGNLYLTDVTIDDVLVEANEGETTGSLLIGIKAGDWYKADDFRLTYVRSIFVEEEPDAIIDINNHLNNWQGVYTIMGTRVNNAVRSGVYIVDGRKVVYK